MEQRDISVEFNLPSNPIFSHGEAEKHYLKLQHSDTALDYGIRVTQSGFPYADCAELLEMFEVRSFDPRSNQVVVRVSRSIEWNNKPFLVDKLYEKTSKKKVEDQI